MASALLPRMLGGEAFRALQTDTALSAWPGCTLARALFPLHITGVMAISAAATQAQSAGRKAWGRGSSVNSPVLTVPDQAPEGVQVAEVQTASQKSKAEKKTDIVGGYL